MKEISNTQLKFIQSLRHKKYREKEQCFLVEGEKGVDELLTSCFDVMLIVGTASYLSVHEKLLIKKSITVYVATKEQMPRLGSLQSNNSVIAVVKKKLHTIPKLHTGEFVLVLDDIRDPGNLGTIIRTADWFGVQKIITSENTVDFYNPKVISATMGSFSRVKIGRTSLVDYLSSTSLPVYGMFLDGTPTNETVFGNGGVIVMGNESHGISTLVAQHITHKINIPRLGKAESLNVAIATSIVLYDAIAKSKR